MGGVGGKGRIGGVGGNGRMGGMAERAEWEEWAETAEWAENLKWAEWVEFKAEKSEKGGISMILDIYVLKDPSFYYSSPATCFLIWLLYNAW